MGVEGASCSCAPCSVQRACLCVVAVGCLRLGELSWAERNAQKGGTRLPGRMGKCARKKMRYNVVGKEKEMANY